jgi:heme-degrading monooxygenase HmoA
MIAIARFKVPTSQSSEFERDLAHALTVFSEREGFISGDFGQNLDENELWTLVTHWKNVGSYRRALSSTQVKMEVVPLLATAIDEPGAYERSTFEV